MTTDIDLVIPMVFPSDPVWQLEYRKYKGGDDATQHVRYRSWGTEELLVRCCLKYMPWLHRIFLVLALPSQEQEWMRRLKIENGKLKIVFHGEFMPEEVLPCFSSPCIEMFLHRIPGLSEHFIYGNDDMFPLSPLEPENFFREMKNEELRMKNDPAADETAVANSSLFTLHSSFLLPCQHITERAYPATPNTFERKCMWQQNMIAGPFGLHFTKTYPDTGHVFSAILKSSCEEVWRRHGDEITKHLSPLKRTDHSANNWIFQLYQQYAGLYVDHRPPRHYTDQGTKTERLAAIIADPQAGIVCLNDNEGIKDWEQRAAVVREAIASKLKIENGKLKMEGVITKYWDNGITTERDNDRTTERNNETIDVLVIHYNTPKLTAAALRSLWLHTPEARVTVFDNSDVRPFPAQNFPQVTYIDNTQGQVVKWEEWLEQFTDKIPAPENNWGSAKHCYSVELCMDRFPNGFILMDSDVLIKRDAVELVDRSVAWKGGVQVNTRRFGVVIPRVIPYLCWINTPLLKAHGIRYFNGAKMWNLTSRTPDNHYDTGAWLLEACNDAGMQGCRVEIRDYIVHYGHASWRQRKQPKVWLQEHKALWWTCPDTKIYVCTHTDFEAVVHNPVYEVVDARTYNGDVCENGLRGSFYSELILYKYIAERGDLPEYVGFCGYRKYFSFMDDVPDVPMLFRQYDAIAASPVRVLPDVRGQYARCHNVKDLDVVGGIIREHYPDLWPVWQQSLKKPELYACNMFILRREDFRWLIKTVFDILDRYLAVVGTDIDGRIAQDPQGYHIGRSKTSTPRYQYRIGGFLGERIVNALLRQRFPRRMHYDRVITGEAVI